VFVKYGAPPSQQNFNLYRRIATDMFALRKPPSYAVWADLREMLFSLCKGLERSRAAEDAGALAEFRKLNLVAHLLAFQEACTGQEDLKFIQAKQAVSLIRYTDVVPADKAFFLAGDRCRKVAMDSMAFVFFNRYLDLSEGIDDGELGHLDNTEFAGTDVPFDVELPEVSSPDPLPRSYLPRQPLQSQLHYHNHHRKHIHSHIHIP